MERLDVAFKTGAAVMGAVVGFLFGGWSEALILLLSLVGIDYLTGFLASAVEGKLSSRVGFRGIPKKIMIFVMVAVGHLVDTTIGTNHMFRDATIFFYCANELVSIIENAGRMGLPVPEILRQTIDILRGKSEKGADK
ncbi:phage holin family protein [Anoxybacillus flavithermus]|uniref:phage holin family protein n=1 Tax=Anoxybacillus flavithermus TaxID=33934 RepID=UPI001865F138|nr:phage holin family protein [Anoxybacillus flavithermus]MBE2905860.1 phage holin family protein [Anoxybacillus flavithermus]MBE2918746.1 phage holin family protein [Anoxybacillus flavithermus]MBE2921275.1 phage holin family protein [Anoxybacillus flavithermus]MBE2926718.1 phage holin family protein [Anoxybacillus flavithermus]MBE2937485.1 phage holin family protein [Anoxybacillus flavithermus]